MDQDWWSPLRSSSLFFKVKLEHWNNLPKCRWQLWRRKISNDEKEDGTEEVIDFATLLASADIEKGKKVFGKCKSCHKLDDGANGVGPHLYKVINRDIGSIEGFKYSKALMGIEGVWSIEELNKYLTKPSEYAPGTAMSFAGLKKDKDRADLIEYLNTLSE